MGLSEEELDAFGRWERQAWGTRAGPYAEGLTRLTAGGADLLLDAAHVTGRDRVLDVATGPGVVAAAARRRGAAVVGVDQEAAMARMAGAAGVPTVQAAAERLPLADATFDAVVAGFLLNHLARADVVATELARVCTDRVAVSVWDVPAANAALSLFGSLAQSLGMADVAPAGPDSALYADDGRLTALLAGAGLGRVSVRHVRWTLSVDPGAWFDAVAAGTPRTGAALAAAGAEERARLRRRYLDLARASYPGQGDMVDLPAAAVVGSGSVLRS